MRSVIRYTLQLIGLLTVLLITIGIGLMAFAGHWMNVNDEPMQADYILPLAGDRHRLIKAAQLYRSGYSSTILISNAITYPASRLDKLMWEMGYPKHTRDEFNTLLLQKLGAQSARLEKFGNGHISTYEEVEALKKHLDGKTATILVVTSPYHAKRAKMIFEEIMPNYVVRIISTEEGAFKAQWWKDQQSAQLLVMEFAKTLHYLLGGAFRANKN